jgi:hypothetical protein
MRAWTLALAFGLIGILMGKFAVDGAGLQSQSPLWCFSGGAWGAILGAVLGGTLEITAAIRETRRDT